MNSWKKLRNIKFVMLAVFIVLFGCSSPLMDIIKEEVAIVVMPPGISTFFPEADSEGNSVTLDNVLLTFTKQINSSSVNSTSFIVKDSEENIISGSYSVSNDTISFNPSSTLSYNTTYIITAKAEIRDVDGNQMGSGFSWSFKTADAPAGVKPLLQYVRLNDNQSATNSPSVKLDISATDYTGNIQNLKTRYRVSGSIEWGSWLDMTDGILTIPVVTLDVTEDGDIVTFEVEVKDSANIVSNLGQVDITYDTSPPEVQSRNWLDAEFDLTQGILQIDFDGEMDLNSFSSSNFFVELEATPGALQGQIDLIEANDLYNSAVILQGVSLNPYTDYKMTLGSDITDIAGNERGETTEWTFRTGKANDVTAPEGDVILIDRGVGAFETILPTGTLATDDYRIRLDLTGITDDYSNIVGMKFWGDDFTSGYVFEPSSWEIFPTSNIYKDWNVSNTAGTKTVLYKFIDSNNQYTEGALQVEVFLDNAPPEDPVLTINEGDYTNNTQRIVSLAIDSTDVHTGLKEMNVFDGTTNDGWIDWSPVINEWTLPDEDGTYTITVNVRDYVNLTSSAMDNATVLLDRLAPQIIFVSDSISTGIALPITNPTHYTVTDPDPGTGPEPDESGIASYYWEQITGTSGAVIFSNQELPNPTVSATLEGSYYLKLTVTDNAGNSSSEDVLFIWDDTPPGNITTMSVTESNPGYSTSAQPEWSWSEAIDADYYRISWNNFGSSEDIGNVTVYSPETALSEGLNTLYVRAYDFAGNPSATKSQGVTVDTVAPAIDVDQSEYITYTGDSQIDVDFSTNDGNFGYISGADSILWEQTENPPGGTITFGSASASLTSVEADVDGNYQIRLTASDNAGNSTSVDISLLNDLTIPGTPTVTGPDITPSQYPTWYWSSGGGGLGIYQYNLNGGGWSAETSNTSYTGSNLTDFLTHTLQVREKDDAGNLSLLGSKAIFIDTSATTPPIITIGDGEPQLRTINSITWDIFTGSGGAASQWRYQLNSTTGTWNEFAGSLPEAPAAAQTVTYPSLADGTHTLYVQEWIDEWEVSETGSHTISIDTIAPSIPNLTGEGLVTNDINRTATNDNYPTWSWSSGGGGNGQYQFSTNGGSTWTNTTGTSFTPYQPEGTYTLLVRERDDAGNWSTYDTHSITVDTTAPILNSLTLRDPSPYNGSTTHTNSTTVYVDIVGNISAEDEDVTLRYLDYNPVSSYENYGSPFSTDGTMTISTVLPSTNGTRSVYAQLVDEAGNGSAYKNDSIILDTVVPSGTFYVNNNASYTPSLSYNLNFNITDNISQITNLKVSTRDVEDSAGGGTNVWSAHRSYSAVMSSDYQFSDSPGGRYAYAYVYDEAGNGLYLYDYIILQVPEPLYAYKGYYTSGYSNVYYTPVTEDPGSFLTRYYVYSTSDPNADPNNGDPVTSESYTTSTTYKQAYIPKGEILYFFTRAYNADTGGWGPYSASSVMGFSSNVTIVYDKSDSTDALKAQYMKELLENTYYSGGILSQANMAGSMPNYTVTLLDEDLINNSSYSTYNLIYGDPVIVTPGTAFTRLSSSYDIRARHIAASGKGIMGMGSNGLSILDRIQTNWSSWGLTGTSPSQIGSGPSAGLGSNISSKSRAASTSESIWHSPMQNTYFTSNFYNSYITLNMFTAGNTYRYGAYLGSSPVVSDGYVYAGDPNYGTYYPVVRQGRFLQYGYTDIPGRTYSGATTYQYGPVFFINLIARMDNY